MAQQIAALSAAYAIKGAMAVGEGLWLGRPDMIAGGLQMLAAAAAGGVVARQLASVPSSGGGGGATSTSLGGNAAASSTTGLRSPTQPQQQGPTSLSVTVQTLNPKSVDWDQVWASAAEAFGRHLERGGSTGPVTINYDRK